MTLFIYITRNDWAQSTYSFEGSSCLGHRTTGDLRRASDISNPGNLPQDDFVDELKLI